MTWSESYIHTYIAMIPPIAPPKVLLALMPPRSMGAESKTPTYLPTYLTTYLMIPPKVLLALMPPRSMGADSKTPAAEEPSPYSQANVHTS